MQLPQRDRVSRSAIAANATRKAVLECVGAEPSIVLDQRLVGACDRRAEVQRPLATVVIGGLISATLLTLFVLLLNLSSRFFFRNRDSK